MPSLRDLARPAVLGEAQPRGFVRCLACAHRCRLGPGRAGICGVRFNDGGRLMAPWGYVSGAGLDPIEKKPFFHVLPGASTLSFGMYGCNFRCAFCQNWQISEPAAAERAVPEEASAPGLASGARRAGASVLVSTYNEPLITAEWSAAVFSEGRKLGLRSAFVSNGYATPEAVAFLRPALDFWKVDLKCFTEAGYSRVCGARLDGVLDGIRAVSAAGFWVEVVTLLVPGFNDSDDEVAQMAAFVRSLSPDTPWHLTAFHPDYRMTDTAPTPPATLLRAREAALSAGLRYVYCGNVRGAGGEDTACPSCGRLLVERDGFRVVSNCLGRDGRCSCGAAVPGVWE